MTERTESLTAVADRVRYHKIKQERRGLTRVSVWVPKQDAGRLRDLAHQFRHDAKLSLSTDNKPLPKRIEVPTADAYRSGTQTVFLNIKASERGLQMLLRANGGVWMGQRKLWEVPACLPAQIGLTGRVVYLAQKQNQKKSQAPHTIPSVS